MELLKRISGYTIISIITGGISFLLLPVLTTYLSPKDYGILSIFNASTQFLVALIPLGMGHLLLVYLIEKKIEYPTYLNAFLKITFTICLSLTAIISIAYFFIKDFFGLPFYLTISLPFIALLIIYFDTINSYFIYSKQFKRYAKFTLSKFFIEVTSVITLVIIFPFNWKGRITALVISLFLMILYTTYYFTKNNIIQFKLKTTYHTKELINKGFPLIFMGIAIMVMNLSDRFFIEHFVSLKDTGLYGIASTVAGVLLMVIGASMNVIRPIIYEKLKSNNSKKELRALGFKYISSLLLLTFLLYLITPFLFQYMVNESFHASLKLTYPLIWSIFFWGVFNYFVSFFMFKKRNIIIGTISILGVILNLVLNYFLILKYGTIGAAYATLITYLTISLILIISYLFLRNKILL